MQYTFRRVPAAVDRALRERAAREKRSMNEVALEALAQGLGVTEAATPRRDLSDLAGRWVADKVVDRALAEQRTVDPEIWR